MIAGNMCSEISASLLSCLGYFKNL